MKNQTLEELKRKALKSVRQKSKIWTAEEIAFAKAKAKETINLLGE